MLQSSALVRYLDFGLLNPYLASALRTGAWTETQVTRFVTPALSLQWLIGDRDSHCGVVCTRTQVKPVCGSDGRSYESTCELQRARCRDKTLTLAPRSRCRGLDRRPNTQQEVQTTPHHVSFHLSGRNWAKIDPLPAAPAPTSASEVRDLEVKGKTSRSRGGGGKRPKRPLQDSEV